jgi:hypothetical protein
MESSQNALLKWENVFQHWNGVHFKNGSSRDSVHISTELTASLAAVRAYSFLSGAQIRAFFRMNLKPEGFETHMRM